MEARWRAAASDGRHHQRIFSFGVEGRQTGFLQHTGNTHLYSLPLDGNRGKVRGAVQRLTNDAGMDISRSISGDGKKIVFTSSRNGANQIWVKDMVTGVERALTTGTNKTQP